MTIFSHAASEDQAIAILREHCHLITETVDDLHRVGYTDSRITTDQFELGLRVLIHEVTRDINRQFI